MENIENVPGYDLEAALVDILPLLAENLTPQLGYKLELSNVLLSDIAIASDYRSQFQTLVGSSVQNEAKFVYTYNPLTDRMDLETIRLELADRLQSTDAILADCIYLQKFQDGFVQTFGLGDETLAEVPIVTPTLLSVDHVRSLLEPVGLFDLGGGDAFTQGHPYTLDNAEHWKMTEQQTTPLPSHSMESQQQMIITRSRQVSGDSVDERNAYSDAYTITFQSIGLLDKNLSRHIEEATLKVEERDSSGYSFTITESSYDRYDNPMVINLPEVSNAQESCHPAGNEELQMYLTLIESYAA